MPSNKRKTYLDTNSGGDESSGSKKTKTSLDEIISKHTAGKEAGSSPAKSTEIFTGEDEEQSSDSTLSSINRGEGEAVDGQSPASASTDTLDKTDDTAKQVVDVHVAPESIQEYSDELKKCILTFLGYQNTKSNIYALSLLPAEAKWGVDRPFNDKSTLLCKPGTNSPYLLWVVGRISRLWFFNAKGETAEHASIHVVPLTDGAAQKACKVICNLSKPAIASTEDSWANLRATKWLTERVRGQGEPTVKTFSEVYDARQEFGPKAEMACRDISEFSIRDLVLLELRIRHYRVKTDEELKAAESSTRYKLRATNWERWRARYEIHAISLLKAHEKDEKEEEDVGYTSAKKYE
ncbi:hypothetical protein PILCRDRAFT_1327 [Piloderma croceum F 1598]|uniref:Uncharacterized protein n=1 Tax=Piloderma croceum (strain F 1598) TaxID=765440 RepID=A0A0C3GHK1_PILCF|nr:hypothetical protein PILCRDRAFT_1327 [Piloderma croceum F 1598]